MSWTTIAAAMLWLKNSRSTALAPAPHAGRSGSDQLMGSGMPTPAHAMWPPAKVSRIGVAGPAWHDRRRAHAPRAKFDGARHAQPDAPQRRPVSPLLEQLV